MLECLTRCGTTPKRLHGLAYFLRCSTAYSPHRAPPANASRKRPSGTSKRCCQRESLRIQLMSLRLLSRCHYARIHSPTSPSTSQARKPPGPQRRTRPR